MLASLDHRQPDRIPFDLGGSSVSTLHVQCVGELREHYRLRRELVTAWSMHSMAGFVGPDLAERMGSDTRPPLPAAGRSGCRAML